MSHKLGVLVIHGMGSHQTDYAQGMIGEVSRRLAERHSDPDAVCWEPVFWSGALQARQDKLWKRLSGGEDLDFVRLRKFMIGAMGDAVAYLGTPTRRPGTYERIHSIVLGHLKKLRRNLGGDKPLVVMAHSLGSVIMSNYIWDRQQRYRSGVYGRTSFERMETLAGLVTFGSSLPLFTLTRYPIVSIRFPSRKLRRFFPVGTRSAHIRSAAKWLNFFDADDILGYPLKPISPSYNRNVSRDIEINVGGILSSWNPISHSKYWLDKDFIKPASGVIADLMRLL
jgi:pimeloyl-ACP methyl ester carboxylesterase